MQDAMTGKHADGAITFEQITCCALWWISMKIRRTLTFKRPMIQLQSQDLRDGEADWLLRWTFQRNCRGRYGVAHHTNITNLPPSLPHSPSSSRASRSARTYTGRIALLTGLTRRLLYHTPFRIAMRVQR